MSVVIARKTIEGEYIAIEFADSRVENLIGLYASGGRLIQEIFPASKYTHYERDFLRAYNYDVDTNQNYRLLFGEDSVKLSEGNKFVEFKDKSWEN